MYIFLQKRLFLGLQPSKEFSLLRLSNFMSYNKKTVITPKFMTLKNKSASYNHPNPCIFSQEKRSKIKMNATKIVSGHDLDKLVSIEYSLDNFHRSNQDTCLVHKPSVFEGQWVQSGDLLADCSASIGGELALGQNILIAYMPWEGYNFEDAILISERLVYDDLYTSVHIERYEVELRETKQGNEEITREIPDIAQPFLTHLNKFGIAKLGTWVEEGDILVGKVTPVNKKIQSNYQKLLYTILDKTVLPIRDSSLRAPKGIKAKVIGVQIFKHPKNTLVSSYSKPSSKKKNDSNSLKTDNLSTSKSITQLPIVLKKNNIIDKKKQNKLYKNLSLKSNNINKKIDMVTSTDSHWVDSPRRLTSWMIAANHPASQNKKNIETNRNNFFFKDIKINNHFKGYLSSETLKNRLVDWSLEKLYSHKNSFITNNNFKFFSFSGCMVATDHAGENNSSTVLKKAIINNNNFITDNISLSKLRDKNNQMIINNNQLPILNNFNNENSSMLATDYAGRKDHADGQQPLQNNLYYFFEGKHHKQNCQFLINETQSKQKMSYNSFLKEELLKKKIKKNTQQLLSNSFKKVSNKFQQIITPPALSVEQKTMQAQKNNKRSDYIGRDAYIGQLTSHNVSSIQIYLAEKRRVQVGDKMAGRHGNKGIISQILPIEDMPFLPDGKPLDMVLNPLGVPSRMNVGQIYECLLGLAGKYLGENFKVFPFDEIYGAEASRSFVFSKLYEARLKTGKNWLFNQNSPGKIRLYDGRSGETFDQPITVGYAYMLRLVHMVDDKIHARSTGPYSLVTQQPLRGRSKQGGQRLGEMEVWALEGYGAAFTLLEMLTIKSDDMTGRMTLWSNLILNKEISIGTPESFKVLICELQALCLDIGLFKVE